MYYENRDVKCFGRYFYKELLLPPKTKSMGRCGRRERVGKENKEGQRGRKGRREKECGIEATAAVCLTLEMV